MTDGDIWQLVQRMRERTFACSCFIDSLKTSDGVRARLRTCRVRREFALRRVSHHLQWMRQDPMPPG